MISYGRIQISRSAARTPQAHENDGPAPRGGCGPSALFKSDRWALLHLRPLCDRPGFHDAPLPHTHQPLGQVDGGAHVRGNDLHEVADPQSPRLLGQLDAAVLFPEPIDLTVRVAADLAVAIAPAAERAALGGER